MIFMHKGVTLLETVVVIAIIGVLSTMGINNINSFRRDAALDATANEIVSMIKLARGKSMNGELLPDEEISEFFDGEKYNLPEYGISVENDRYSLIRKCLKNGVSCSTEGPLEEVVVDSVYTLLPTTQIYFSKITGEVDTSTVWELNVMEKNGSGGRKIILQDDFVTTISKI